MKTKNILIGLTVLASIYFLSKFLKWNRKPSDEEISKLDKNIVLSKGSEGSEVYELQRILKDELGQNLGYTGFENNGLDGVFGVLTEKALLQALNVKEIALKDVYAKNDLSQATRIKGMTSNTFYDEK